MAIADQIRQFKNEDTKSLPNIDASKKPGIISSLGDKIDDPVVFRFMLSVASDTNEYDLARIEVFKVLEVSELEQEDRGQAAQIITQILQCRDDLGVQNYAAMAASNFMDFPFLFDAIAAIVNDHEADMDLRFNAFAAIKAMREDQKAIEQLRKLTKDPMFQQSAARVLSAMNL